MYIVYVATCSYVTPHTVLCTCSLELKPRIYIVIYSSTNKIMAQQLHTNKLYNMMSRYGSPVHLLLITKTVKWAFHILAQTIFGKRVH